MEKIREYLLSAALGIITGVVGVYLMGYLAAIAIPKSVFEWFDENLSILLGRVALDVLFQFLAYGILGILSGLLIGKVRKTDWRVNALVYYFSYIFYLTVGIALIYKVQIQPPVPSSYLKQTLGLPFLVLPLCIVIAGYYTSRRMTRL